MNTENGVIKDARSLGTPKMLTKSNRSVMPPRLVFQKC